MSGLIGGAGQHRSGMVGGYRGNVPFFSCKPPTDVTLTPNSGTFFLFSTTEKDTHGGLAHGSDTTYTCKVAGLWSLNAYMSYTKGTHSMVNFEELYQHIELTPAATSYADSASHGVPYMAIGGETQDSTHELTGCVVNYTVFFHVGQVAKVKCYTVGGTSGIKYSSWSRFTGHLIG